jgi:hypothetical protein
VGLCHNLELNIKPEPRRLLAYTAITFNAVGELA